MSSTSVPLDETPPEPAPRDSFTLLYRVTWLVSRTHFILWHGLKIEGTEHFPKSGGLILAANHQSHFDPPLLGCSATRQVHFLAKSELFEQPFLKWLLPQIGQVSVTREGSGSGMAVRTATRLLQQGKVIGMFPEGTRSKTGTRQEAHTGVVVIALMSGVPILPAYIYGTYNAMPPGSKVPIPGRRVGIRWGEPFTLDRNQISLKDRPALEAAAEGLMDRIFALQRPGDPVPVSIVKEPRE